MADSDINHHWTKTVKTTSVPWQTAKRKLAAKCDKFRQITDNRSVYLLKCNLRWDKSGCETSETIIVIVTVWLSDIMTFLIWSIETNELQAFALPHSAGQNKEKMTKGSNSNQMMMSSTELSTNTFSLNFDHWYKIKYRMWATWDSMLSYWATEVA